MYHKRKTIITKEKTKKTIKTKKNDVKHLDTWPSNHKKYHNSCRSYCQSTQHQPKICQKRFVKWNITWKKHMIWQEHFSACKNAYKKSMLFLTYKSLLSMSLMVSPWYRRSLIHSINIAHRCKILSGFSRTKKLWSESTTSLHFLNECFLYWAEGNSSTPQLSLICLRWRLIAQESSKLSFHRMQTSASQT